MTKPSDTKAKKPTAKATDPVVAAIYKAADELGVPRTLALAIAQHESGLNPTIVGDQGTSFGLFQLHRGGELGSLTQQQANDPYTNAHTALSVVAQVMRQHPEMSPGQIAAAAQRPADPGGYATAIDSNLGHTPTQSSVGGSTAALTGLFDPNATVSIEQYGFIAALAHKVPDLQKLMAQYAGQDLSSTAVQARLEADIRNTGWFQKTTDAQRQAQVLQATNPAEYMKQFRDVQTKVSKLAAQLGVGLPGIKSHDFAAHALNMGWDDQTLRTNLLAEGVKHTATDIGSGAAKPGLLQTTESDLRTAAQTYMVPLSPAAYSKWSADIAGGRVTPADFETYLKEQAKSLFPSMGAAIDRGITPSQYLDPYRQYAASILEKDPASIDFAHDPTFGRAVFQVDPKTHERTAMNLADWQTYLRGLPDYKRTAQAKDQAAQMAEQIATTFGKVA